jgi:hypothetical protein
MTTAPVIYYVIKFLNGRFKIVKTMYVKMTKWHACDFGKPSEGSSVKWGPLLGVGDVCSHRLQQQVFNLFIVAFEHRFDKSRLQKI